LFPYPVGFSDHTPGWDMDIAAVALGADLVEKTITEDKTTRSVEHIMSLELAEIKAFVRKIKEVEIALGQCRRRLLPDELEKRKAIRRSVFLKRPVLKGQLVSSAKIEFRRPGYGISPKEFEKVQEEVFSRDLPAGHMIRFQDLKGRI
jgi:sialic acid synthase SpsE